MKIRLGLVSVIIGLMFLPGIAMADDSSGNWVAQLSEAEFQELLNYRIPIDYIEPPRDPDLGDRDFPESLDWRELNGVSPVRNQAQCGSCWAFTATGVLESQVYIDTGVAPDYSEQQLVDCTPGSYGCNGGSTESAWEYLRYDGFCLEADYPYEAKNMECRDDDFFEYIRVTGYEFINTDVDSIKAALSDYGPVATVIGANNNLQGYSGGCYQDDSNTQINHGVVIVGWDDNVCEGGSWICKNSWGQNWGDHGFFYIRRGDVHIGEYSSIVHYESIPPVTFSLNNYELEGDDDNIPSTAESLSLRVAIENTGRQTAGNISATLVCDHPEITITRSSVTYPDMNTGDVNTSAENFEFSLSSGIEPGAILEFQLTVSSDGYDSTMEITMVSGPLYVLYHSDFEDISDQGWTHAATARKDSWLRGKAPVDDQPKFDPAEPFSGDHMWGTGLNYGGSYIANSSLYLESPAIETSGHSRVFLSFQRWLTVEEAIYDQAGIWVNDTKIWENAQYGHHLDNKWVYCTYEITDQIQDNSELTIKFSLDTDQGLNFGGWNIDDLQVFSTVDSDFYNRFIDQCSVDINVSTDLYSVGDLFDLQFCIENYSHSINLNQWIVLDVYETYWFHPTWTQAHEYSLIEMGPRTSAINTILYFEWPEIVGHATGIRFWGAVMDQMNTTVLDYDYVEWGW